MLRALNGEQIVDKHSDDFYIHCQVRSIFPIKITYQKFTYPDTT